MSCISCGVNPAPGPQATKLCGVCTERAIRVFKPVVKYTSLKHGDLAIRYSFYLEIGYVFVRVVGPTDRTEEVRASILEYFGLKPFITGHFPDHTLKISPRVLARDALRSHGFSDNAIEYTALIRVEFRVKNIRSLLFTAARRCAHYGIVDGVLEDVVDIIIAHNSLLAVRYLYAT